MAITRKQREAILRVYNRTPICAPNNRAVTCQHETPLTFRQFRKTVVQGYDCLMVQWCNMWLGIEKDGYTHS